MRRCRILNPESIDPEMRNRHPKPKPYDPEMRNRHPKPKPTTLLKALYGTVIELSKDPLENPQGKPLNSAASMGPTPSAGLFGAVFFAGEGREGWGFRV